MTKPLLLSNSVMWPPRVFSRSSTVWSRSRNFWQWRTSTWLRSRISPSKLRSLTLLLTAQSACESSQSDKKSATREKQSSKMQITRCSPTTACRKQQRRLVVETFTRLRPSWKDSSGAWRRTSLARSRLQSTNKWTIRSAPFTQKWEIKFTNSAMTKKKCSRRSRKQRQRHHLHLCKKPWDLLQNRLIHLEFRSGRQRNWKHHPRQSQRVQSRSSLESKWTPLLPNFIKCQVMPKPVSTDSLARFPRKRKEPDIAIYF